MKRKYPSVPVAGPVSLRLGRYTAGSKARISWISIETFGRIVVSASFMDFPCGKTEAVHFNFCNAAEEA